MAQALYSLIVKTTNRNYAIDSLSLRQVSTISEILDRNKISYTLTRYEIRNNVYHVLGKNIVPDTY